MGDLGKVFRIQQDRIQDCLCDSYIGRTRPTTTTSSIRSTRWRRILGAIWSFRFKLLLRNQIDLTCTVMASPPGGRDCPLNRARIGLGAILAFSVPF